MVNESRLALLKLAARIGRALRDEDTMLAYQDALSLLLDVENELTLLARSLPQDSRLSGRENGYLPSRHPLRSHSQTEDFTS